MKTLVAFYSRTGTTKKVAEAIAKELKADIDEIADKKDRSGNVGWLVGGRDAFVKEPTEIAAKKSPAKYGLVVVGTPVWAATMAPAVREYLKRNKLKKAAFFCTFGGSEGKTFAEMEALAKKPIAALGLRDRKINEPESVEKIKKFCCKARK